MAKSSDGSVYKYKAISGRVSDYFGFKLSEDGSVSSPDNVYCMTCDSLHTSCLNSKRVFSSLTINNY